VSQVSLESCHGTSQGLKRLANSVYEGVAWYRLEVRRREGTNSMDIPRSTSNLVKAPSASCMCTRIDEVEGEQLGLYAHHRPEALTSHLCCLISPHSTQVKTLSIV